VSAAIIGTLAVALLAVAGWLMFRSVTVASIAALLGAVDGLMFVESRLALLDIFQMFWILATFVCLLLDRQAARRRLAANVMKIVDAHGESGLQKVVFGPGSGLHLWRLAAGICAGAAVAVKWNSLFFIAAMGVLTVFWDMNARRILGLKNWGIVALIREGIPAFIQMIGVGLIVYLTTWIGWFKSSNAFYRHWSNQFPDSGAVKWLPEDLRLLWEYHTSAFKFHSGLSSEHRYASQAWQWLILGHPTSYYYEAPKFGEKGCTALNCSQAILNIGNPLIWWVFIPAIILALVIFILKRDWRFGALLLVFAAGYLPWFLYPNRTMFFFYALSFEPFLLILLAGCLGVLLGNRTSSVRRVRVGVLGVGIYLTAVLLVSAYFWPLWTGQVIPYEQWYGHMWIPTWI
jgi:integral membrane protein